MQSKGSEFCQPRRVVLHQRYDVIERAHWYVYYTGLFGNEERTLLNADASDDELSVLKLFDEHEDTKLEREAGMLLKYLIFAAMSVVVTIGAVQITNAVLENNRYNTCIGKNWVYYKDGCFPQGTRFE